VRRSGGALLPAAIIFTGVDYCSPALRAVPAYLVLEKFNLAAAVRTVTPKPFVFWWNNIPGYYSVLLT
jgi:hypothetical protein